MLAHHVTTILIVLTLLPGCYRPPSSEFAFNHHHEERSYRIHLPSAYKTSQNYPLVLNFHGLAGTPKQQEKYTQMDVVADREQFIVVYPKGNGKFWNTGLGKKSYRFGRDDVGFINALLDTLQKNYSIDINRIYFTGLSLGAYFSYRLSCELYGRVAAIASVAGVISDSTLANCLEQRPIPVLHIHGTADKIVDYEGIKGSLSVEKTIQYWQKRNHCTTIDTIQIPDVNTKDKSNILLIKHGRCDRNAEVWYYKIIGGGHTWPGTKTDYIITGRINKDIHASEIIWDFLKNYHR